MKRLQLKLGLFILFSFLFMVLLAQNVFSCTPAGPDPWFNIELSFDQTTLPSGIEIVQTDSIYEPYILVNKNLEPFYLVRENFTDWKTFPNSELPKNYEPLFKITSNQVYFWGQLSSQDTEEWKPVSGVINNSPANGVRISEGIYILDGESKQIYQDNRPAVVDIPAPQNFKILGFYKGNPVEIKGVLSYSLNDKYDPQRFAKGVEACNKWDQSFNNPLWKIPSFMLLIIILVILLGLSFLIYKIIKKFKE